VSDPILVRQHHQLEAPPALPCGYNYVVYIDDALMEITTSSAATSTSRTLPSKCLYEAFGWAVPELRPVHILGADRERLSKRHGATSIALREMGYLPERW